MLSQQFMQLVHLQLLLERQQQEYEQAQSQLLQGLPLHQQHEVIMRSQASQLRWQQVELMRTATAATATATAALRRQREAATEQQAQLRQLRNEEEELNRVTEEEERQLQQLQLQQQEQKQEEDHNAVMESYRDWRRASPERHAARQRKIDERQTQWDERLRTQMQEREAEYARRRLLRRQQHSASSSSAAVGTDQHSAGW